MRPILIHNNQMKNNIKVFIYTILLGCSITYAQMQDYSYKSKLTGVKDVWHSIALPDEVFSKVSPDLSDVRVFGITSKNDTIEAPYILRLKNEKVSRERIPFTILNTTYNDKGSYITMEVPTKRSINQITLNFKKSNFDWLVTLEGSQDRKEWFTITEDYRILSIKNELTNYKFTTLQFPKAQYKYFRILVKSNQKPILQSSEVIKYEKKEASYRNYEITNFNIQNPKDTKQTIIDVKLQKKVPVSYIYVEVQDTFDYYRPISIRYVTDSIQNPKGEWIFRYRELNRGILNSIESNGFVNKSTIAQKLRIVVDNHDNQPLKISKVKVKGYQHELVTRFTDSAAYYLVYGNNKVEKPFYDLNYVTTKLPEGITTISPGVAQTINYEESSGVEPLFTNKIWLWAIMLIVILLLGGFTLSMIKKSK